MKIGLTNIVFILDKSGSMGFCKDDVIGGFNTCLKEQQELKGEALMSVVLFSDVIDDLSEITDIKHFEPLTNETYIPCGLTALHDAVGQTIVKLGNILNSKPETERPEKVIIIIMTDGHENASKEYSAETVKELVEHQKEKYNWEFIYLGANQDAKANSRSVGVDNFTNYTVGTSKSGIKGSSTAYHTVSGCLSSFRTMGDIGDLNESIIEE